MKDEQKIIKNEGLDSYLKLWPTFEYFWSQEFWSKSTKYLTVLIFWIDFFPSFFNNSVRAFFKLSGEK